MTEKDTTGKYKIITDNMLIGLFFLALFSIPTSIYGLTREVCKLRLAIEQAVLVESFKVQNVTLTAYTGRKKTAIQHKPISGWTVAISDDLFAKGWLGRKVYIDSLGVFHASDRMAESVKGNHIDILASNETYAINFGVKQNVMAVVLD